MRPVPVVAWLPLKRHENIPVEEKRGDDYRDRLPGLVSALPTALATCLRYATIIDVSFARPSRVALEALKTVNGKNLSSKETDFVRIDASIDTSQIPIEVRLKRDRPRAERVVAGIFMADAIEDVLLCSELSLPSLIDSQVGIATAEGTTPHRIRPKSSYYDLRYNPYLKPAWPEVREIPLDQIVNWLSKTTYFVHALPTTRIERCFAAYSHVIGLTQQRDGEVLFRAMQGLEAFYCDGVGDLRKQLSDKSAILLGKPPTTKNLVGQLYDQRSKFVHGAAVFPYFLEHLDAWILDDKGQRNLDDARSLAVRLLVATIQYSIAHDIQGIGWEYVVTKGA